MTTGTVRRRAPAAAAALLVAVVGAGVLSACSATLDATPPEFSRSEGDPGPKDSKKDPKKDDPKKDDPGEKGERAPEGNALAALDDVRVKGRSARTGYDRDAFGSAWSDTDRNGCDQRNDVLRRDLEDETIRAGTRGCVVLSGTFEDPYTGTTIRFRKADASQVQIDHVVALSNAWVTGASGWSESKRRRLANDPLNLLASKGSANQSKGDSDAATWLPPNRRFRCDYVARQVAVKVKYDAWMTRAEHAAVERVLSGCPDQKLPVAEKIPLAADPD